MSKNYFVVMEARTKAGWTQSFSKDWVRELDNQFEK